MTARSTESAKAGSTGSGAGPAGSEPPGRPADGQPERTVEQPSGRPADQQLAQPGGEQPGRPAAAVDEAAASDPAAIYGQRRERFADDEAHLGAISLRLSIARGAVFAAFAGCLLWLLLSGGRAGRPAIWGAAAALAVFVALAVVHEMRLRVLRRAAGLRRINDEGSARLRRDWD